MSSKTWAITGLCSVLVLLVAWLAYAPALGGVFLLDDAPNLSGLATIGKRGASEFILTLAMLTKENGALLPAFLLIVEATLLVPPRLIALTYRYEGNHRQALAQLRSAIAQRPSMGLNELIECEMARAGDFDQARDYLSQARDDAPSNPMHRLLWMRQLNESERYVERLVSIGSESVVIRGTQ